MSTTAFKHGNREAWLLAAVDALAPIFKAADVVPVSEVAVSCGWPSKAIRRRIGECWPTKSSNDSRAHLFVSPTLADPVEILGVLAHELIHAIDDCQNGHHGPFARMARGIGLAGKLTATVPGETLKPQLVKLAADLGPYPHGGLNIALSGRKTEGTRMLKVECPSCGYVVRTTAKWLAFGLPTCPCGEDMVQT